VKSRRIHASLAAAVLLAQAAPAQNARVWEVNGIRLESSQVERLASDIARQTVAAVERQPGLALQPEQAGALEAIYYAEALDTYDQVVAVVNRSQLDDAAKEAEVKRLVIAGQERSSERVAQVLAPAQYATYRAWEQKQLAAFEQRGLWSGGRRGRRNRR
jgi:Spy/CpxP family protein refolding chaperone